MEQSGISIITPPASIGDGLPGGKIKGSSYTIPPKELKVAEEKETLVQCWFKKLMKEDGTTWDTVLSGLAELIGTAMLVLMGCMGCVGGFTNAAQSNLQTSLSFGLAVMIVIQCIGHISTAHINPAITVGSVVLGKKSLPAAMVYLLAQSIGAILGYGLLKALTPQGALHDGSGSEGNFCVTDLGNNVSALQGLIAEGVATAILMFFVSATWDRRNEQNSDSVPIKFGLAITVLAMTFSPYTGCSMNPVRSLGPALWNNSWSHHWIYWFGPIGGALLSSIMYRSIFWPRKSNFDGTSAEIVALNSVETQKSEQN